MADPLARDRRRRPRRPRCQRPPPGRQRRSPGLARQPGELRDPCLDREAARAVEADVRVHRHRPGREDDLGGDPRPGPAVPDRPRPPRGPRLPEDDRQARHPGLDPDRPREVRVQRHERLGRARVEGRRVDRPGAHLMGVGQGGAQGPRAPRLHPERQHQDARRAVQRPSGGRRPGQRADHLGRARRPGSPARPLDDPRPARPGRQGRRPVRARPDRRAGAATGLIPLLGSARSVEARTDIAAHGTMGPCPTTSPCAAPRPTS